MAVDTLAFIPFLNSKFAWAISSTPVSPIVASASKNFGSENLSPVATPAISLEKEIGYSPTSSIPPPAKFLLNNLCSGIVLPYQNQKMFQ